MIRNIIFPLNVGLLYYICLTKALLKLYGLYFFSTILFLISDIYMIAGIPDRECDFTIVFLLMLVFPFILVYSFAEQNFLTFYIFFQWLYQYKSITQQIDENLFRSCYDSPIFDKLDITVTNGKDICAICLEHDQEKYVELPCKHQFHQNCFFYYVKKRQDTNCIQCPICRRDLVEEQTCFIIY